MEENSFEQQIELLKNEYYTQNKRTVFFRKTQKQDCAKVIENRLSFDVLCDKTIYMNELEDLPRVYVDYKIFKSFAQDSNYDFILDKFRIVIDKCVSKYGVYEICADLGYLTITGAHRYYSFIRTFCTQFLHDTHVHKHLLQQVFLYNYPAIIPALQKLFYPFVPADVITKIVFV